MEGRSFYVGNLTFSTTDDDLREFFEQKVGPVFSAMVVYDRESGNSRGFGFVKLLSSLGHQRMLDMNGVELNGRKIIVREANAKRGGV